MCFVLASRYTSLLHLLVALTMHVYILPSIVANEGQLVGSRADYFTVLCMKFLAKLWLLTTHEMENREKFGSASQLGTGKLAERVKVYIVDAEWEKIDKI
jgi:hypothetical protein